MKTEKTKLAKQSIQYSNPLIRNWLPAAVAIVLAIGILPSFLALSSSLFKLVPLLSKFTGPINVLKLSLPLFAAHLFANQDKISRGVRLGMIFITITGTICTFLASFHCGLGASSAVREWAAMITGMIAATSFMMLQKQYKSKVIITWIVIISALAFLDLVFPTTIDWLYANIFDPNTKWWDANVSDKRLLTGVFGFQSMAKLLSWLPWLALAFIPKIQKNSKGLACWIALTAVFHGLILPTTQRGPLIGMLAGWIALSIHSWAKRGDKRIIAAAGVALMICAVVAVAFTPKEIMNGRLKSLVGIFDEKSSASADAKSNIYFRKQMWTLSLESIKESPLGNSCIPAETFAKYKIASTHSHNLFLHQFRERGWIWGAIHFLIWCLAFIFSWQNRSQTSSALFAGVTCIIVQGMFDHPWFVINHSLILCIFLIAIFFAKFNKSERIESN